MIAEGLRVPKNRVTRGADLVCDLGADSLCLAELAAGIESATGRQLPIEWLQDVVTVGDLLKFVEQAPSTPNPMVSPTLPAPDAQQHTS